MVQLRDILAQKAQFLVIVGPNFAFRVLHFLYPSGHPRRSRRRHHYPAVQFRRAGDTHLLLVRLSHGSRSILTMGVVIEREDGSLTRVTPLAYPLLSVAALAAVLLLPYFSVRTATHATGSSCPFYVGTAPFLGFRRAFLCSSPSSASRPDEFARCGLGREQMAARLAAAAAAALFLGGFSGVISDKMGPRRTCIFYWVLQLAVGAMKSFSGLRCAWINNFILALASSVFSFCFEMLIIVEHEKQNQKQDLLFDTFWLMTFFESVSLIGSQGITNLLVDDDSNGFLLPYAFAASLSIVGILYI
ncbi:hypothetical protein EJB05_10156 [Eragrostis curvula]|uniref:Uncharacterized protein n=1 Tax=Eragrostis curvula TaxID=38414 RepID=A0A5J9W8F0_9POAL|nr:hypothetical protein EJB05_10156 [Eragrostis curvula]